MLSANEFITSVQSQVRLRAGRLATPSFSDGRVFVTFVHDTGKFGLTVEGFGQDPTKPAKGGVWSSRSKPGDVMVQMRHSDFPMTFRKKFGSPQVIAKYVADAITDISNGMQGTAMNETTNYRTHWYFVALQDFRDPSLGYNVTLFNRRGQPVGSASADNADAARAAAKKLWPGAVEKQLTGEGVMREAHRSTGHEIFDPDYVIQVIYSDGGIASELGEDDEESAIAEAKQALRSFSNDEYARVITRDGELVWDSRRDKGSRADWKRKYPGETRGVVREARRRGPDVERDLKFVGYDFTSGPKGTTIHRGHIDTSARGDYGADPIGDGTFRMVPSGDIVDFAERNRRLSPKGVSEAHQGPFERHGFELTRPYPEPNRAGLYHYGPATIWVSGPSGGTWWATVKFSHQETDLDARSFDELMDQARDYIDSLPELQGFGDPRSKAKAIETYGRRTRGEMGESRSGDAKAIIVEMWSPGGHGSAPSDWQLGRLYWTNTLYAVRIEIDGGPEGRPVYLFAVDAKSKKDAEGPAMAWAREKYLGDWEFRVISAEPWPIREGKPQQIGQRGMTEARRGKPPVRKFVPDEDEALYNDPDSIERHIKRQLDKYEGTQNESSIRDDFRRSADECAALAKRYDLDVRAQDRAYPGANAGKEAAAMAAKIRQSEAMLRKAAKGTVAREAPKKKAKTKKRSKR